MLKPEQIPPEVVEAVERLLNLYLVGGLTQSEEFSIGHALAQAVINAWPEMSARPTFGPSRIILPLPQENAND